MNRAALRLAARKHLAEAGSGLHNDDDLNGQLDRSARSLAAEFGLLSRRVTLEAVNGVATLPADAVGVKRVWWGAGRYDLAPMQPGHAPMPGERPGVVGRPEHYAYDPAWGPQLRVYPASSVTLTADLRTAGAVMDSDEDQPWDGAWEMYHDVIGLHAADRMMTKGGPTAAASAAFAQRYTQRLTEFRGAVAMQTIDTAPMHMAGVQPRRRRF